MAIKEFTLWQEVDGVEVAYLARLPVKFELCPQCQGSGSCDAWEGGMTSEEMWEQGDDFVRDYLDGVYNVLCRTCNGKRVVEEVDREGCDPDDLKRYDRLQRELFEMYQQERMERMMGC